jgi:hypothetical protein
MDWVKGFVPRQQARIPAVTSLASKALSRRLNHRGPLVRSWVWIRGDRAWVLGLLNRPGGSSTEVVHVGRGEADNNMGDAAAEELAQSLGASRRLSQTVVAALDLYDPEPLGAYAHRDRDCSVSARPSSGDAAGAHTHCGASRRAQQMRMRQSSRYYEMPQ